MSADSQPRSEHKTDAADVAEQRAEVNRGGTVGPSTSSLPEPMARGLWRGGAIGALVGAVVLLPLAALPIADLALGVKLIIMVVVGIAAGGAFGGVFFGSAVAETEDPESDGDDSVVPDQMHRRR